MADVALAAWEAWATVSQAGYGGAGHRAWVGDQTCPTGHPPGVVTNSQQPPAKPQVFSTKPNQTKPAQLATHQEWSLTAKPQVFSTKPLLSGVSEEQVLQPHCNWLITVGQTFDRCGC